MAGFRLDNPTGKALLRVLPWVNKEPKHHRALPYNQVGRAIAQVWESTAILLTKLAFEFLVCKRRAALGTSISLYE